MESLLALASPLLSLGGNLLDRAGFLTITGRLSCGRAVVFTSVWGPCRPSQAREAAPLLEVSGAGEERRASHFLAGHLLQGLFDLPLY